MLKILARSLRKLAKTCNSDTLEERLIRDQVVVGVRQDSLREKLLEDKGLTLDKCLSIGRAYESSKQQLQSMSGEGESSQVQRLFNKKYYHDLRHRAKEVPQLAKGQPVWVKTPTTKEAFVIENASPRSVVIQTDRGTQRRNRNQLRRRSENQTSAQTTMPKAFFCLFVSFLNV